jgi:hypothetical protein
VKTRETLETAIKNWLNRETPDIIARTPDFITLAEVELFNHLRCRSNEAYVQPLITLTTDARVTLPVNFSEVGLFTLGDNPALKWKSQERYANRKTTEMSGTAESYSRFLDELIIWPFPDGSTEPANLWYYERQVLGTDPNDTTPTLTDSPGLYLFGALLEAEPYLKKKEQVSVWQLKYAQAFASIMSNTWGSETAGSTNQVESVYSD